MIIEFYRTASENNRLDKTLTDKYIIDGTLKSDFDIINPVILLKDNIIAKYNYCYIPDLNRYYFIDKIDIVKNTLNVMLSIDVLMSYKEQIKELNVIVSVSESNPYYNNYINGYDVRTDKEILNFENNFNEQGELILIALYGADRGV